MRVLFKEARNKNSSSTTKTKLIGEGMGGYKRGGKGVNQGALGADDNVDEGGKCVVGRPETDGRSDWHHEHEPGLSPVRYQSKCV